MRREVIVVLKAPSSNLESVVEAPGASQLESVLADLGASLQPVFDTAASDSTLESTVSSAEDEELSRYFSADVADGQEEALVERLKTLDAVESAYIKPAVENPLAPENPEVIAEAAPSPLPPPAPVIPDFTGLQGYLGPAPGGVEVAAAWAKKGGKGANVRVIDIEGGWQLSHRDLRQNQGGLVGGQPINEVGWRNHGTAVLGEISGDENGYGIVGLAPEARISAVAHSVGSARAIEMATSRLRAGDILLLEMHRPGPRHNYQVRDDQRGYIAVEWWPDDFLAIRKASRRGVVVVEAAGNGAENLDDALYDTPHPDFEASWRNPFRAGHDSGAIVVGAGAPPSGNFGPDRSRLDFSNHGLRVDCQGWGREVTTTGYGDLFSGSSEDFWYTRTFAGTSSASPIIVGVLACIQGVLRALGRSLNPQQARQVLRDTGSPQQASPAAPLSQRIGARPRVDQILTALGL